MQTTLSPSVPASSVVWSLRGLLLRRRGLIATSPSWRRFFF